MTCSCLGTKRRGFSAHMSCTVTLRPFASACASRAQNDIPEKSNGRHLSCLSACGHKTASTNAPPRVVRLYAIDTARSTIKPPTKTDGVSESVQCVHERAICDTQSQTCPPVLAQRCASCELASDLERRTGVRNQRCPEAPRQPEQDG